MAGVLLQIGVIYFLGHLFAFTFKKYKIPDVLLFMILGLVLGPIAMAVAPSDFGSAGNVLSSLALIVILFESGTTLDIKSLAEVFGRGFGLTMATALITFILAFALSYPFTKSTDLSVLIGVILGGTSSAVVIPMAGALGLSEKFKNVVILESALTDVLCIVLVLALVDAFTVGAFDAYTVLGKIFLSFALAVALGILAGMGWVRVKHKVKGAFATVAFAIGIYGAVEALGFSGPIAVMALGVTLANAHKKRKETEGEILSESEAGLYSELVFVLKTFFFIFLGISMKFDNYYVFPVAAVFTAAIILLRYFIVKFLWKSEFGSSDTVYVTLLIPKGLAAAVLATLPAQKGLANAEIVPQFVFPVVLVSILLVSIIIPIASRKLGEGSNRSPA